METICPDLLAPGGRSPKVRFNCWGVLMPLGSIVMNCPRSTFEISGVQSLWSKAQSVSIWWVMGFGSGRFHGGRKVKAAGNGANVFWSPACKFGPCSPRGPGSLSSEASLLTSLLTCIHLPWKDSSFITLLLGCLCSGTRCLVVLSWGQFKRKKCKKPSTFPALQVRFIALLGFVDPLLLWSLELIPEPVVQFYGLSWPHDVTRLSEKVVWS